MENVAKNTLVWWLIFGVLPLVFQGFDHHYFLFFGDFLGIFGHETSVFLTAFFEKKSAHFPPPQGYSVTEFTLKFIISDFFVINCLPHLQTPKKLNFPSNCAYNRRQFSIFLPSNVVYIRPQNTQKVELPLKLCL